MHRPRRQRPFSFLPASIRDATALGGLHGVGTEAEGCARAELRPSLCWLCCALFYFEYKIGALPGGKMICSGSFIKRGQIGSPLAVARSEVN